MERTEAIEVIRKNWPDASFTQLREALETLVPELRESEDERIRMGMIRFLESEQAEGIFTYEARQSWIAYLEKQKEQKPIFKKGDKVIWEDEEFNILDVNVDSYNIGGYILPFYRQNELSLVEQKPAEWNDADMKEARNNLISVCRDWECGKKTTLLPVVAARARYFLEHLVEPKQPAEWSEADNIGWDEAFACVTRAEKAAKNEEELQNAVTAEKWLKEIKFKYYVHPVKQEWSEDWREEDIQTRFAFYTYKDDSSVLYLSNVFVEETSRNHGFGTRILRAAEKVAETIGATTISLKVKQDSYANAWYRKNGYGYVVFEDGYDWLEKNLEYMKPNKQEWSKEDEKIRGNLMSLLANMRGDRITEKTYQKYYPWLKSLRPSWKPSEDEGRLINISISFLKDFADKGYENAIECIDWLKSKLNGNTGK